MEVLNIILNKFSDYSFYGNTVSEYIFAVLVFFALLLAFAFLNKVILNRLEKLAQRTKTDLDETFISIIRGLKPPFYGFLAFYFALWFIEIPEPAWKALTVVLVIWVVYQSMVAASVLVDYAVKRYTRKEENSGTISAVKLIGKISKGVLWVVAGLFVLSNLGVNITSLVAGLGIGGVAVALALQNILSDLFSSFAIYFDKPFVPGDFIIVGDKMGVVEYIGIKTTRLRALQGEEIVISNQELTNAQIQNFKKMSERRVVINFGVTYETPDNKIKKINGIIEKIIEDTSNARFDRVHFKNFGDSALGFEVVYYVESGDYNEYMNVNQEIHFAILEKFRKEKISMAYPTQTIFIEKSNV